MGGMGFIPERLLMVGWFDDDNYYDDLCPSLLPA